MTSDKPVQTTPPRSEKSCTVEGCKRKGYRAKGYCNVHYKKWRDGELPKTRYKRCSKEGCNKPRSQGAFCAEHQKGASEEQAA